MTPVFASIPDEITSRTEGGRGALWLCVLCLCQNNENPQPWLLAFCTSLGVKIDANMNLFPADSLRQQRWIGSESDFRVC